MERGKPLKRATQTYGRGTCHAEFERTTRLFLGMLKNSRQMIIEGEIHECELNWNKTWLIENCMTQAGAFSLGFF